jgi:hypothetical protein
MKPKGSRRSRHGDLTTLFIGGTIPLANASILEFVSAADLICCPEDIELSVLAWLKQRAPRRDRRLIIVPTRAQPQLIALLDVVFKSSTVILTHRRGWPMLDLAIAIRRPRVWLLRTVPGHSTRSQDSTKDRASLAAVSAAILPRGTIGLRRQFKLLVMSIFFRFEVAPGAHGSSLVPVARAGLRYGLRVEKVRSRTTPYPPTDGQTRRSAILAVSSSASSDEELSVLLEVIDMIREYGGQVFIKDHVRPQYRLADRDLERLQSRAGTTPLDADVPIELHVHHENPSLLVGFGSAGLAMANRPALSLIRLVSSNDAVAESVESYLLMLQQQATILFPNTLEECRHYLSDLLHEPC